MTKIEEALESVVDALSTDCVVDGAYLGINDWKIGPPPNWRDFVTQGKKKKLIFNVPAYIAAVEAYIVAAHKRHWDTICDLDKLSAEYGEMCERIDRIVKPQLDKWRGACEQVVETTCPCQSCCPVDDDDDDDED